MSHSRDQSCRWLVFALIAIGVACTAARADVVSPCQVGMASALQGRTKEAEELFIRMIATDPHSPCALSNLGNLNVIEDHLPEALAFYDQAILSDSLDAGILLNRGMIRAYLSDSVGAVADIGRSLMLAATADSAAKLMGIRIGPGDSGLSAPKIVSAILHGLTSNGQVLDGLRNVRAQLEAQAQGDTVKRGASTDVSIPYLPLYWNKETHGVVTVLYVTDRKSTGQPGVFGSERGELSYGQCLVSIPRDHRMGHLESPNWFLLHWSPDPKRDVVLRQVSPFSREAFDRAVSQMAAAEPDSSALVFIHGYNVSFEDAARRTAQLTYDLGFHGAAIFYSWPSSAMEAAYLGDEGSVEWTENHLEQALRAILSSVSAKNVYLIGHSLGTRALARAVIGVCSSEPALGRRIREVILTAPDIDAGTFRDQIAPQMIRHCPTTLYASTEDAALMASRFAHAGQARAGDAGKDLVLMKGLETIDASTVDTSLIGHSYFAESRSVLSDMYYLIGQRLRANKRLAELEPVVRNGVTYYVFKR